METEFGVHPHLQVVEYEEEDPDDVDGFFSSQANLLVGRVDLKAFLMIRATDPDDLQPYVKESRVSVSVAQFPHPSCQATKIVTSCVSLIIS